MLGDKRRYEMDTVTRLSGKLVEGAPGTAAQLPGHTEAIEVAEILLRKLNKRERIRVGHLLLAGADSIDVGGYLHHPENL
jgi:hypothetical protein